MGFVDKLKGWTPFGGNQILNPEGDHRPTWETVINGEATYLDMTDLMEVYHTIPHLKIAINAKASMTSNGIYKVLDMNNEEVENHPLIALLESPNFLQSKNQFVVNQVINRSVYGNAYILMNRQTFGISSMFVIPTEDIKIEYTGKLYNQTEFSGVIKNIEINQEPYDVNDLIFLKENDDRLIVGESKVKTLKQQLSNIKHAYDARNMNITQGGARGVVSLGERVDKDGMATNPMTQAQKEKSEESFHNDYGLGKGKKKIIMTTLGVEFTSLSAPIKDLQLFEEIDDDSRVLLDTFGLNNDLFSKVKGSTFNNVEIADKRTYQNTIIPEANLDSLQIGKQSGMLEEGQRLTMDFSHLPCMQQDENEKVKIQNTAVKSLSMAFKDGVITIEEYKNSLPKSLLKDGKKKRV